MKTRLSLQTVVTLVGVCLSFSVSAEPAPTVQHLLEEYQRSQSMLEDRLVRARTVSTLHDCGAEAPTYLRQTTELLAEGEKIDVRHESSVGEQSVMDESKTNGDYHQELIWDGSRWYEHHYRPDVEQSRLFVSERKERRDRYMAIGYPSSLFNGIFPGDTKSFAEILKGADRIKVQEQPELINGSDTYIIEAQTENGRYKVWLDPGHGHHVVKAEATKTGDDLYYGVPLSTPPPDFSGVDLQGFVPPSTKIVDFKFTCDGVEFQKYGDFWVPVRVDWSVTIVHESGRKIVQETQSERVHIELSPDFRARNAFVPKVRNGTRVDTEGKTGIVQSVWQEGEPLPKTDNEI